MLVWAGFLVPILLDCAAGLVGFRPGSVPSFQDAWGSWFSSSHLLAAPFLSPLLGALPSDCIQRPTSSHHLTAAPAQAPPLVSAFLFLCRVLPAVSGPTSAPLRSIPKTASRALFKNRDQSISSVHAEPPSGSPSVRKSHIFDIVICFYSLTLFLHAVPFLPLQPP